jgi:hypothetical protein
MTKITTKSSRTTILLSWSVAAVSGVGLFLFLWLFKTPEQGKVELPEREKNHSRVREIERIKQDQAQRALPENYARDLIEQAERQTKRELELRLNQFRDMAARMRERKENLLKQIESRQLPPRAPADANNTALARQIPPAQDNLSADGSYSVEQIYETLRQYEVETQQNYLAVNAARQALSKGLSFPDVYRSMKFGSSFMMSFEELIRNQAGGEWARSAGSNASAGLQVGSTAELNNYRGLLGQSSRQAGLAGARLEGLFSGNSRGGKPGNGQPGSPYGEGSGEGNGGPGGVLGVGNTRLNAYTGSKLNQDMVMAQALPGRRFSREAARKGWLYVNTWYMIGPWDNFGLDDFAIVHPPEISIDFDATYIDGQVGIGRVETDAHPIHMIGSEVRLDGTLRWQFMQSESMHNVMPVTTNRSTCYAYTQLYFDEPATMLVAIGTDDSGRVWINGKDVWQDKGSSYYYIDEHIATFRFDQGWNSVLIRLENGDGPSGFSFLILPEDAPLHRGS